MFGFLGFSFSYSLKNNSKTKVEKVFFFIFMSSYAEMSFFKRKKSLNRVKKSVYWGDVV
jgi:hypothetical protein